MLLYIFVLFQTYQVETMEASFLHLSQDIWNKVLDHAQSSVVFFDSKAGECLHWSMGVEKLLLQGALAIREFSAYKASIVDVQCFCT